MNSCREIVVWQPPAPLTLYIADHDAPQGDRDAGYLLSTVAPPPRRFGRTMTKQILIAGAILDELMATGRSEVEEKLIASNTTYTGGKFARQTSDMAREQYIRYCLDEVPDIERDCVTMYFAG